MHKILVFFLVALISLPAWAETVKPKTIEPLIHARKPLGQGELKRFFIKVYDASIWTDDKAWSLDKTFALSMVYNLNLDTEDLVDNTIEQMEHEGKLSPEQETEYKKLLATVFPEVNKGDNLVALSVPGKGITFYFNDRITGTIANQEFAERFFAIWFSPKTSEPGLRQALLGGSGAS